MITLTVALFVLVVVVGPVICFFYVKRKVKNKLSIEMETHVLPRYSMYIAIPVCCGEVRQGANSVPGQSVHTVTISKLLRNTEGMRCQGM